MQRRQSRVTASIVAPNYGRMLVPGQEVDLDERLPHGGTLADVVDESWFEPIVNVHKRVAPASPARSVKE